ncbi:MAG: zf-HC2 domain-containing protein [Planctomycetota bacterium]
MSRPPREDACTFVRERTELFLDGELTGSENLFFTTHLKECEDCAGVWSDDESLATALLLAFGREPLAPVERLFSATGPRTLPARSEFDRRRDTDRRPPRVRRNWLRPAAGVAAAGLIAMAGWAVGRSGAAEAPGAPIVSPPLAAMESPAPAGPIAFSHRRGEDAPWRPVGREEALAVGDQIWASEGEVAFEAAPRVSIALGDDAVARVTARPDASGAGELGLSLGFGRLSVDAAGRPVEVVLAATTLRGDDAAFVASADLLGERLVVLRGRLSARLADGEVHALRAGEAVEFDRDGGLRALTANPRGGEGELRAELAAAQERLSSLLEDLREARLANARLHDRVAELESGVHPDLEGPIEVLIERYLVIVDQTNSVRLEHPAPIALATAEKLAEYGPDIVGVLYERVALEETRMRRRALVGLLALVDLPGTRAALERLCFEVHEEVREAALFCLALRDDPDLGPHFVTMARVEKVERIRLRAALHAARAGEDEGARVMASLYAEEGDGRLRTLIPRVISRLEGELPSADRFLRCLLLDRGSDHEAMAFAIRGLVDRADVDAIEVLREFSEREDVGADLREQAREAIRRLEVHY